MMSYKKINLCIQTTQYCSWVFLWCFISFSLSAQYDENGNTVVSGPTVDCEDACSNPDPCLNLICNGDFAAAYYSNLFPDPGNIFYACPWASLQAPPQSGTDHAATPDFFHTVYNPYNAPGAPYMGVPDNQRGSQNDHSPLGNGGYAGIYTYAPYVSANNEWREYIYQKYGTPLIAGQSYTVEFYLSLAEESQFATTMEVLVTQSPPSFPAGYSGPLTATPDFVTPIETNYSGWTHYSFNFTPSSSGIYYLVFGNFHNNATTTKTAITIPPVAGVTQKNASYYYIDDVRISVNSGDACCNFDVVIEGVDPFSGNPPPVLQPGAISPGQHVYITGYVAINQTMTFSNVDFAFGPDAALIAGNNTNLNFSGCHLYACTDLWQGIVMHSSNAALWMSDCLVEDAEKAAWLKNGNAITLLSSTFTNNHIAIHLDGYANTWPVTMENNLFNCTANLLPPRQAEKSETGILVDHVSYLGIMASGTAVKNQFRNLCKGIVTNNSSVIISSAYFYGIRDYNGTGSWSIAMHNGINATTLHEAKVTNLTGYNEFVNCDNGIMASGTLNVEIKYNRFSNINGTAIRDENNNAWPNVAYPQVDINYNYLRIISREGIDLYNTGTTKAHIWRNRIVNPGMKPYSTGIQIINPTLGSVAGKCGNVPNKLIEANYTERFKTGIYCNNIYCMEVVRDTVNLRGPNNDQYHGIWTENSRNANIHENVVTGDYADDWRSIGIRTQKTPYLNVYCNKVDHTSYALWFHQNNVPAKVYQNTMTRYKYGLALAGNGVIGAQVFTSPYYYAGKNWWDKAGGTNDWELYTDGTTNGNNSSYYFLFGDPNNNTNTTNLQSGTSGAVPFQISPPFITSYALNHCSGVATEPQGMVAEGDLADFYREENFWMQAMNLYIEHAEGYTRGEQETRLVDSLRHTPVPLLYRVDTLVVAGDLTTAADLNSSFAPGRDIEAFHQNVNAVLIPFWKNIYNGKYPRPGDAGIDELMAYARACPYQYGEAVYKARIFLHEFINDSIQFYNTCEPKTGKNLPAGAGETGWTVQLYPNPARDDVQVELSGAEEGRLYTIELRDVQGRLTGSFTLQDGYRINITNLKNGVYLYTITDGKNMRHGKLVVQK